MGKANKKQLPLWLDTLAKKYWAQFANNVNLDDRFLYETLAHYCSFASEYRRANDEILRDGLTISTYTDTNGKKSGIKIHPAVQIKSQAMTHMQRLSKMLFSPEKDAGKIEATELTEFFGD